MVGGGTSIHKTTKEYCNEEDATPLCRKIEFQSLFCRDTSLTILVSSERMSGWEKFSRVLGMVMIFVKDFVLKVYVNLTGIMVKNEVES